MKIYLGENSITLVAGRPEKPSPKEEVIEFGSKKSMLKAVREIAKPGSMKDLVIWSPDTREGLPPSANADHPADRFFSLFKVVEAAGGMVVNEKEEVLFIHKRGKWDLPKGKISASASRKNSREIFHRSESPTDEFQHRESPEETALREVKEETGLMVLRIDGELPATYHIYLQKGRPVLKRTYWYSMSAPSGQTLVPDRREKIIEVKWIAREELPDVLLNTYPSVRDLFIR
jgi:8-oxo-dGTP pyrophosphatase MutT (NUDIX family)